MKLFDKSIMQEDNTEKVSIIIPIYNTEDYLEKCIISVLNQTYKNLEIILINDGSSDSSADIAKKYVEMDKRVLYFEQKNSGVSSARNYGLDLATGDYILFIDSDDWVESTIVEKLLNRMHSHNVDISCCQYDRGAVEGNEDFTILDRSNVLKEFLIHKKINGSLVNKLFRTSVISDTRLDVSISYGEDALFLWKILLKIKYICVSNEVLYHVTLHGDSATGGGSYKVIRKDCIAVWSEICCDAKSLSKDYEKLACIQLANMAFFSLYDMAYYDYHKTEDEDLFLNVLRNNYKYLKCGDFIPKMERMLAYLMVKNMNIARFIVRIRLKLSKTLKKGEK